MFLFNEKEKALSLNVRSDLKKEQDYTSGDWVDINDIILVNLMIHDIGKIPTSEGKLT